MTSLYKVVDNGDLDVVEGLLDLEAIGKRNKSPTNPRVPLGQVSKLPQPVRPELQRSPLAVVMKVVRVYLGLWMNLISGKSLSSFDDSFRETVLEKCHFKMVFAKPS